MFWYIWGAIGLVAISLSLILGWIVVHVEHCDKCDREMREEVNKK